MQYYKLDLNNCVFWQNEVINDEKVFIRKTFSSSANLGLDRLFLNKISDTEYMEIITRKILEFDDKKCINIKGSKIALSKISKSSVADVNFALLKIKNHDELINKYFQILNNLFVRNNQCQIKYERKLRNKKILK